jgi:hypothetical protein
VSQCAKSAAPVPPNKVASNVIGRSSAPAVLIWAPVSQVRQIPTVRIRTAAVCPCLSATAARPNTCWGCKLLCGPYHNARYPIDCQRSSICGDVLFARENSGGLVASCRYWPEAPRPPDWIESGLTAGGCQACEATHAHNAFRIKSFFASFCSQKEDLPYSAAAIGTPSGAVRWWVARRR